MLSISRKSGHTAPRLVSVLCRATQMTILNRKTHSICPLNTVTSASASRNSCLQPLRNYMQSSRTDKPATTVAMPEEDTQERPLGLRFPEWIKSTKVMPRLTEEDVAERLRPLTEKYLWQKMSRSTEDDHLYRRYVFKGPNSARRFVAFLMHIEEEYDHHTAFSLSSERRPVVQVLTQTHAMDGGPGISLKDLHLAALAELHYRSGNYEPKSVDPTLQDVWNLST